MSETTGTPPTTPAGSVPRSSAEEQALKPTDITLAGGGTPPGGGHNSGGDDGGGDDDEEGMVKMSFLEHLEELRSRIMRAIIAVVVGFGACFWFAKPVYDLLVRPIEEAQRKLHQPVGMFYNHPTDAFNIYLQIGLVCGLFLASPYVLAQVWGFISPGLYKREKKYAVPFVVLCTALFLGGGAFGYFVAIPYALEFLLGLGGANLKPIIFAKEYFDLFTVIILGLGIIFEMPILILILSVLRIVSPRFLLKNFRYAVLVITIIAAIVTPTTDVMNMMVFEIPMLALYLLGVLFAWLVVRHRDKKKAASA